MQDELQLLDDLDNFKKNHDDYNEKMEAYKALLNRNIKNIQESLNKL
jgi:hypothetical protein